MPTCKTCHFLAKERNVGAQNFKFSLSIDERNSIDTAIHPELLSSSSICCHMGVWDSGVSPSSKDTTKQISLKRNKIDCFYIEHKPSMLFPAAETLQKRQQETEYLKKSNMYTRIGLYIAAGALVINSAYELLTK